MIYFLTVNYNSEELIRCLIDSISQGVSDPYKIIIVNNSPQEKVIQSLASDLVTIIESGDNIGFGRACNLGVEQIYNTDPKAMIWLINPDATLDPQADIYIKECFEFEPSLAILGTRIRDTEGGMWFASGVFNPWTGYINHSNGQDQDLQTSGKVLKSSWVSGCSLIINLERFTECPVFDSRYFLYFEDAELCVRHARQGYTVAITRDALVTHQVSAIIGQNKRLMFRYYTFGRLLFLRQYATCLGFWLYLAYLLVKILSLLVTDFESAQGRWQGLKDFIAN